MMVKNIYKQSHQLYLYCLKIKIYFGYMYKEQNEMKMFSKMFWKQKTSRNEYACKK